jgi:nucleotide-binding universal stress UspA family protein
MKRDPIQRILCAIDFSEFSVMAYEYASSLAPHYGARLYVQHVLESWQYPSACFVASADEYDRFCKNLKTAGCDHLHSLVKDHSLAGLTPECVIQDGPAADCIVSCARNEAVNLIVVGTHGIRGFDRAILGSVTEKVLRKARCSVLAVHHTSPDPSMSEAHERGLQLRKVLFCTDFSEYSNRAFDYALSVATAYDASLTVLHVVDGMSRLHGEENASRAYEVLRKLIASQSQPGCRITATVRVGRPYREISLLASEMNTDLVIMAVRGRNALDTAIFGSTTYRVLCLGSCPVLAVHPEDIPAD